MTNTRHPESGTGRALYFRMRRFTLIELSVVLLILSIMLTAGMPALTTLAQGRSVDTAARTLQSTLRQARMQAITGRQYVAVLLPTSGNLQSATMGADSGFTAYRICVVNKPVANSATFSAWLQGSKMEYIPTGSLIGYVTTVNSSQPSSDDNPTDLVATPSAPIPPGDAQNFSTTFNATCRAVIFKPSGRIRQNSDLYVYLIEGSGTPSSSAKNIIQIKIDAATGKASTTQ